MLEMFTITPPLPRSIICAAASLAHRNTPLQVVLVATLGMALGSLPHIAAEFHVKDSAIAEKLIPKNHGLGMRRVPLETGYYEVYNQPNVELVDINETPIERITPRGIKTSAHEHEFDIIIYATGFDAITGSFDRIDIRGVDGVSLKEKWENGPQTFLGIMVDDL